MVLLAVACPYCQSDHITKRGKTDTGKQRYRCQHPDCPHHSEEDASQVGDQMAEVGAQIVEDLDILIALAPFVVEQAEAVDASPSTSHEAWANRSPSRAPGGLKR